MSFDISVIWEEYNIGALGEEIKSLFPEYSFDLGELFTAILKGDIVGGLGQAATSVMKGIGGQIGGIRNIIIWLLVLGVIAALITHFVGVFENHQIADIGFYFVYLLLITILLRTFQMAADITVSAISDIISFIQVFIPTYFLSVGVATGTTTATAYYQLLLVLIYVVQNLMRTVVIPAIYSYVLLTIINGIWIEERLSLLTEFLHKAIKTGLKSAIGIVSGVSVFQAMITPVIDSVKASALQKTVSAIPGVGNIADGVVNVVLGSAIVIKNSIGLAMLVLLLAICLVPLLKIFMIATMLKLVAALLGIISDKRITSCTDKVGNASVLLFKTAGTALLLFLISISVVAYTTNRGF